jgi:hypothetical protein
MTKLYLKHLISLYRAILPTKVIDLMPKKSGSSIKTMVTTSSQRDPLNFWPRPFEEKQWAKVREKYGKIGYFIEF